MQFYIVGSWNLLIKESNAVACADNSSLVAEASCAVAELDCTTSEICSTPNSVCFIASACSFAISLIDFEDFEINSIPSTIRLIEAITISTALLPSAIALREVSINVLVSSADFALCSASWRIWSATTANPLPASPALAASIEAFKESKFVCDAISSISEIIFPT